MKDKMRNQEITICACISRTFINKDKVTDIAATLKSCGYSVRLEADLCKTIMTKSPDAGEIASSVIIACYPRAVRSLFDTLQLSPRKVFDARNHTAEDIYQQLRVSAPADADIVAEAKEEYRQLIESFPVETGTDAWYPTIDRERCSDCEQCHDFCLFGVYSVEDGQVVVSQPQNCKNNCPACARVCPSKAVIFPKYERSPINGGLENEEEAVALDTKALYNDALRMRLEQRRKGVSLLRKNDK